MAETTLYQCPTNVMFKPGEEFTGSLVLPTPTGATRRSLRGIRLPILNQNAVCARLNLAKLANRGMAQLGEVECRQCGAIFGEPTEIKIPS